jgi:Thoeris protein ThsB, TIR-like domain
MARRVFFSFHFDHDVFRANQVRMENVVAGPDEAGFFDHSEYEEAKRTGPLGIRRMILRHLNNTTVTVVLIGTYTAWRPWVQFEIAESIRRRNGILGIHINHLRDHRQMTSLPGPEPFIPFRYPYLRYGPWDGDLEKFAAMIEWAGRASERMKGWPLPLR